MNSKDILWWSILAIVLIVLTIIVYTVNGNLWAVQVLSACLGAVITIIATRLLLSSQSRIDKERRSEEHEEKRKYDELRRKAEDEAKRKYEIYNAKLKVYSDFVSNMYEALSNNLITEQELLNIRTKLFGQVSFYIHNKDVLECIKNELDNVNDYTDDRTMSNVFAGITSILQKDLREDWPDTKKDVSALWEKFEEIMAKTKKVGYKESTLEPDAISHDADQQEESPDMLKRLEEQSWHFIMWSDEQLVKLKDGFKELSLVEYEGIIWRTNLVKQVGEGDIIMLFRRGGFGYVGAYKAIGWRVFYFEENREEVQIFGKEKQVIMGEQYLSDIKIYDIYNSKEDGATTCANIIVEPIAFVENGVGNPGGVYRRTISRYDSHYAWLLMERFKNAITNNAKI